MNVLDRLSEQGKKDFWASLALRGAQGMTPRLLTKILRAFHSAYAAYETLCSAQVLVSSTGAVPKIPPSVRFSLKSGSWRGAALAEWQEAQKTACEVVLWNDYRYPLALKYLPDAPPFFYAKGQISLLSSPALAIVGARKPLLQSVNRVYAFARELSSLGLCIVSGMARGIDAAAHGGALQGQGKTIAVLGTGINIVYPREHRDLYEQIAENGLIVSEFSPFSKALAHNFPVRNRLITGISEGVLIVEAALKSGSLITARLALEQNKNVYVCPPPLPAYSLGCQKLLEEGALSVRDCRTIVADLVPALMLRYESLAAELEKSGQASTAHSTAEQATDGKEIPSGKEMQCTAEPEENSESTLTGAYSEIRQKAVYQSVMQTEKNRTAQRVGQSAAAVPERELESNGYAAYTAVQKNPVSNILQHRPKPEDDLQLLNVDFGGMAQEILHKKSPAKKTLHNAVRKKKADSRKTFSEQQEKIRAAVPLNRTAEISVSQAGLTFESDSPIISVLQEHGNLCADEILLYLQSRGAETDMAGLTADLLMLEVEGRIEKLPGARYGIIYG